MSIPIFEVRDRICHRDSPWTATERLIAMCIADYMGKDGHAWPSVRAIGEWTGLDTRTIERGLPRLTGPRGPFSRTPGGSAPGGRRLTSQYRLRSETTGAVPVVTPGPVPGVGETTPGVAPHDPRRSAARPPAYGRTEGPIEGPNRRAQRKTETEPPNPLALAAATTPPTTEAGVRRAASRVVAFAAEKLGIRFERERLKDLRAKLRGGTSEAQLIAHYQQLVDELEDTDADPDSDDVEQPEPEELEQRPPPLDRACPRIGPARMDGNGGFEYRRARR